MCILLFKSQQKTSFKSFNAEMHQKSRNGKRNYEKNVNINKNNMLENFATIFSLVQ